MKRLPRGVLAWQEPRRRRPTRARIDTTPECLGVTLAASSLPRGAGWVDAASFLDPPAPGVPGEAPGGADQTIFTKRRSCAPSAFLAAMITRPEDGAVAGAT